jgi:hypothetical protein
MKEKLFDPFLFLAGGKALFIGLIAMAATAFVGYYSYAHFDGLLDFHTGTSRSPWYYHAIEQALDWGLTTIVFYLSGKLFTRSSAIRLIDVAGTLALARWPLFFNALIAFGIDGNVRLDNIPASLIVWALVGMVFVIWSVILMYNALKVSCNIKKDKMTFVFIVSIVVAELVTKSAIYFLLTNNIKLT